MLLLEKFCSLTTFWSNQLHLSKLNGELGSETSDMFLDHLNFPCPFRTTIFGEKAEVVERLDTCDGREDLSSMIRLSVMRKLKTILTTATSFMIPACYFCPKMLKEKCVFFVKKPLWVLRILWNTSSITTSADADTFCSVICTFFYLV